MTMRAIHYAIGCLFLLFAFASAIDNAEAAVTGEENESGSQLAIDAPSWLRDTLQGGLDISR